MVALPRRLDECGRSAIDWFVPLMKNLHVVGYSLMVALLLVTFIRYARENARLRFEKQLISYRLHWIEDSALRLSQGEGRLSLYSMKDADQLLACFASREDVESISLEMTDVGPVGLSAIASMPNVRQISFSGDFGVNDETLLGLARCGQLESLDLTCTRVTDAGVTAFQSQLPGCRIKHLPSEHFAEH